MDMMKTAMQNAVGKVIVVGEGLTPTSTGRAISAACNISDP
jgi:hypothetical protein